VQPSMTREIAPDASFSKKGNPELSIRERT
jgi:hypothetical protein